jgi:hypothetical protein
MKNHDLRPLALGAALLATSAYADIPVPRADNIDALASNCGIGPFEQTTKAGQYNPYCTQLTDAEKCLALVKKLMTGDGVLHPAKNDSNRASYCLDEFRRDLLGN